MLGKGETCKCMCTQVDMQASETSKNKTAALEDANKKWHEKMESRGFQWLIVFLIVLTRTRVDLQKEALNSEAHGFQLVLSNVKVMAKKAELEFFA